MIDVGIKRDEKSRLPTLDDDVLAGYRKGLELSGFFLEGKVVRKINSNISPALKPSTIKKKGSSKSLVHSGELRSEVTHKAALGGDVMEVGVFGGRAGIGNIHEFGAPAAGIPERSFLRSTANEEGDKVLGIVAKEIDKAITKK